MEGKPEEVRSSPEVQRVYVGEEGDWCWT
jgi:ABC-type branched-subunit amino acid transport system ATPase component